jgi:hypothetical protein
VSTEWVSRLAPRDPEFMPTPAQLAQLVEGLRGRGLLPAGELLGRELEGSGPPFTCQVYDMERSAFDELRPVTFDEAWWTAQLQRHSEVWWHFSFYEGAPEAEAWATFDRELWPLFDLPCDSLMEYCLRYVVKFEITPVGVELVDLGEFDPSRFAITCEVGLSTHFDEDTTFTSSWESECEGTLGVSFEHAQYYA